MARHQHLSAHQQGIVKRYYHHLDAITLAKLQELVSELAVAEGNAKAQDRLWKRVERALAKADADPRQSERVLSTRDVSALARLVGALSAR
ncbi:MAG: hypothetical protein FJ255_09910 [Phycisphaerae bacterium]|nr:hypothetical protein [Phycisphaerae bacterium]